MSDILEEILATKRDEVAVGKNRQPLAALQAQLADAPVPRGFARALGDRSATGEVAVIAEIKRASPSKGLIREDFDVIQLALDYQAGGATALSVLTDRQYFQGSDEYLRMARAVCDLPILRKDFMIDPWQIYQSRILGADAILLIVAALSDEVMAELAETAAELGLDVLVEVHDADELSRALKLPCRLLGINNRDLRTFETSLATTEALSVDVPDDRLLISESGIATYADIERLQAANVRACLVGESLMRQPDVGEALRELRGERDS